MSEGKGKGPPGALLFTLFVVLAWLLVLVLPALGGYEAERASAHRTNSGERAR